MTRVNECSTQDKSQKQPQCDQPFPANDGVVEKLRAWPVPRDPAPWDRVCRGNRTVWQQCSTAQECCRVVALLAQTRAAPRARVMFIESSVSCARPRMDRGRTGRGLGRCLAGPRGYHLSPFGRAHRRSSARFTTLDSCLSGLELAHDRASTQMTHLEQVDRYAQGPQSLSGLRTGQA